MAFGGLKGTLSGSATSITNPISATGSVVVAVGDLVFAVGFEQTLNTWGTTATDNLGNTYAAVSAGSLANAVVSARAYYSRVTVAGTLTSVNLPATASGDNAVVLAAIIEGPFVVSPLDKAPADVTQDLTTPYTGPSTTTLSQALEAVVGWMGQNGNVTLTATSPNLKAIQLNTASILTGVIGYQAVAATTAVSPAWTSSATPTSDVIGTASFKQAIPQTLSPGRIDDADVFLGLSRFATLNPADKNAGITLSNGNLTASTTGGSADFMVRADTPLRSGKWYWEATFTGQLNTDINVIGVQDLSWPTTSGNYPGGGGVGFGRGQNPVQSAFSITGGSIPTITQFLPNTSVLAFAYDADAQKLWCWDPTGSAWIGGGSPSAGTLPTATFFTDTRVYPAVALKSTTASVTFNFGASAFTYSVPSGFTAGVIINSVLPGAASATLGVLTDSDSLFAPTVSMGAIPSVFISNSIYRYRRIPDSEIITPVTVAAIPAVNIFPDVLTDSDTLFAPGVAVAGVTTAPFTAYAMASPIYSYKIRMPAEFITPPVTTAPVQSVTPALFADSEGFFSPTIKLNVIPGLLVDSEVLNAPTISSTVSLTPSLLVDSETVGAPVVAGGAVLTPGFITDSDTLPAPAITTTVSVTLSLFTDSDVVFAPVVTGAGAVIASLFTDAETFFTPTVAVAQPPAGTIAYSMTTPLVIRSRFIPPPMTTTVVIAVPSDQTITPNTITESEYLFYPAVAGGSISYGYRSGLDSSESVPLILRHRFIPPMTLTVVIRLDPLSGDVSVSPTLFTDADNFFAPVVLGRVTVTPTLFTDADNFFAPTVGRGAVAVTPALFTDADTIFAPAVAGGGVQAVVTNQIVDVDNLFGPTLIAGGVSVTLSLFTDAEVFFAPTIALRLTPSLFTDAEAFFAPAVKISVLPTLFTDAETFFTPAVGAGAVTVSPSRIVDAETLFTPTVGAGISPSLFTDAEVFFAPTLAVGAAPVHPGLLVDAEQLFSPQLIYNQRVFVGSFADDDTLFMPTFQLESHYDFPIGKSLDSDYGIRKSRLRRGPYIIGRR